MDNPANYPCLPNVTSVNHHPQQRKFYSRKPKARKAMYTQYTIHYDQKSEAITTTEDFFTPLTERAEISKSDVIPYISSNLGGVSTSNSYMHNLSNSSNTNNNNNNTYLGDTGAHVFSPPLDASLMTLSVRYQCAPRTSRTKGLEVDSLASLKQLKSSDTADMPFSSSTSQQLTKTGMLPPNIAQPKLATSKISAVTVLRRALEQNGNAKARSSVLGGNLTEPPRHIPSCKQTARPNTFFAKHSYHCSTGMAIDDILHTPKQNTGSSLIKFSTSERFPNSPHITMNVSTLTYVPASGTTTNSGGFSNLSRFEENQIAKAKPTRAGLIAMKRLETLNSRQKGAYKPKRQTNTNTAHTANNNTVHPALQVLTSSHSNDSEYTMNSANNSSYATLTNYLREEHTLPLPSLQTSRGSSRASTSRCISKYASGPLQVTLPMPPVMATETPPVTKEHALVDTPFTKSVKRASNYLLKSVQRNTDMVAVDRRIVSDPLFRQKTEQRRINKIQLNK